MGSVEGDGGRELPVDIFEDIRNGWNSLDGSKVDRHNSSTSPFAFDTLTINTIERICFFIIEWMGLARQWCFGSWAWNVINR